MIPLAHFAIGWSAEILDEEVRFIRAADYIAGFQYKEGHRIRLMPFDDAVCGLEMTTNIRPFRDVLSPLDPEMPISIRKILPRGHVVEAQPDMLIKLVMGLVYWWETHEMGEWLKHKGRRVLDLEDDHAVKPRDLDDAYREFNDLIRLAEILTERFRQDRLKSVSQCFTMGAPT